MLSLGNSETTNCVVYLENYLDCVENLPDDLQKHLTRMRELDVLYQGFVHDIETLASKYEVCVSLGKTEEKNRLLRKAQSTLISARELGDEKLQIVQQLQDLIENRTLSLDNDYRNIDNGSKERDTVPTSCSATVNSTSTTSNTNTLTEVTFKEQINVATTVSSSSNGNSEQRQSKRVRRGRGDTETGGNNSEHNPSNHHHPHPHHYSEHGGSIPMPRVTATLLINNQKKHSTNNITNNKKKKRKTKQSLQRISLQKEDDNRSSSAKGGVNDDDDEDVSIDPDEPTYCLCDQISYGEMICCDNDLCPIEWFHFSCVTLTTKPKGKWFCPKCRGDRPNVMKPKAQFLKELERYNREKEEKARSY